MKTTYDEILNNMKNTFYQKCGKRVETLSDLGARFSAVASELYSLQLFGEYILRQAFPQTATGEYLDQHAQLRSIVRKQPTMASGELTFSLLEVQETDVEIPQQTICSVADKPFIQFATTQDAVISAGELSVTVSAQALDTGEAYNADAGTVTVLVNPPNGVALVSNLSAFTGGTDLESDSKLQRRISDSYGVPSTGINATSIAEFVMQIDDVLDCKIKSSDTAHSIDVLVQTSTGFINSDLVSEIDEKLATLTLSGSSHSVTAVYSQSFDVSVEACVSKDAGDDIQQRIEQAINDYVGTLHIEEDFSLSRAASAVTAVSGVEYCDVYSSCDVGSMVICNTQYKLKLDNLVVNCYEQ